MIEALRQAESGLETYRADAQQAEALDNASTSASRVAQQVGKLFLLSLVDAQRSYASGQAAAASARTQLRKDEIDLFLSLGGGRE